MSIITYPLDGKYYNAQDAETYLCTRTSGVFSQDISFTPNGMNITVSPFLAWIKNDDFSGKSVAVTTDTTLTISPSEPILSRIDRIVLRFDARKNGSELMVLKGTPSSSPAVPSIERTPVIYDLCLCQISVKPSATSISAGDITSTLLDESLCGIMRDGVTGIPTLQLQSQAQDLIRELEVAISMAENGSPVLQSLGIKRGMVDVTIGTEGQKIYSSNDVTFDTIFLDEPKVIVTRKYHSLNETVFKYIKPQESVRVSGNKFNLDVFSEKDIPTTLTLRYNWIAIGRVAWDNDSGGGNGGGGDGGGDGGGEEDDTEYFTISTSVDPAGSGITEGAGNFAKGSKTTLVARAFSGYMFEGWYSGNSKVTSNAEYTVTVNSNATYTAKFIEAVPSIVVQINVEPAGTGTVSGAGTYEKGSTVNLGATPKDGYKFVGWYVGSTRYASTADYSVTLNSSTTFTARFEEEVVTPDYYTVTAKVTPTGSGTVTGGGQYVPGATAKLKATANEGYVFSYWSSGTETITSAEFTFVVSSERTWTAHFIEGEEETGKVTITTSVEPANSGTVTGGGKVTSGSMSAVQANANSGYKFKHWRFENGTTNTENPYLFRASADRTFVAVFEQGDFYTIGVHTNNANYGTVSGGGSYEKGSTAKITATPNPGYKFKFWVDDVDEEIPVNPLQIHVTRDYFLTAVFEVDSGEEETTYTKDTWVDSVLYVGTEETNIETDDAYSVDAGLTEVIIPEGRTKIANYVFSECSNLAKVTMPSTMTSIGMGAFDGCSNLTEITYNGTKSQWNNVSKYMAFDRDLNDITIHCTDGDINYVKMTISVSPEGSGRATTSPSAVTATTGDTFYVKNSEVTFTASHNSGYSFKQWKFFDGIEEVYTTNPMPIYVGGNSTMTAVFVPTTCTVTTEVTPEGSGTVTGGGTYTSGSTATLSATAIDGYRFSYWEFDDGSISDDNPCYKTVNKDFTATAVFINVANGVTYKISSRNAGTGDTVGLYSEDDSTGNADLSKPLGTVTTLYAGDVTTVSYYAKPGTSRKISSVELLVDGVSSGTVSGEDLNDYIVNGALNLRAGWYDKNDEGKTHELVVYFTSDSSGGTHTITIGAFDGHQDRGSVTVSKDGNDVTNAQNQYSFNVGETITVTAAPNGSRKFTNWSINNGESFKSDNPYTFTVATNINKVGAMFSAS